MTPQRDPERDLDELLSKRGGEIGDLYRRLPHYEPPRRLDRAVLGEAARAVHSGRAPRRQRWIVAFGSAAGLVLAAGIAWRIGHDPMNGQIAAPSHPRAAPSVVPVQPIDEPARARREQPMQSEAPTEPSAGAAPASPAPTGVLRHRSARPEVSPSSAKQEAFGGAPPPPAAAKPAAAPLAAPVDAFPKKVQENAALEDEKAKRSDAANDRSAAAAQTIAPSAARETASPSPPSSSIELRRDMQLAPRDWLAHIRDLQQQGRLQQAAESLRLFHRAHPDRPIPDDLRSAIERELVVVDA